MKSREGEEREKKKRGREIEKFQFPVPPPTEIWKNFEICRPFGRRKIARYIYIFRPRD